MVLVVELFNFTRFFMAKQCSFTGVVAGEPPNFQRFYG